MATNFPGNLDSFTNPGAADLQNSPGALNHATQHDNINDAVAAVETKVGINGSADSNSLDFKVTTNTTNITNLNSSNPAGAGQGQVFIAATATAGTAINNAYTSFGATPGVIQLGKGTFTLDTAVILKNNMTIRGMGRNSTFIVFNPTTIPVAFTANPNAVNTVRLDGFRIQSSTDGQGTALDLGYVNYAVVTNFSTGASGAYPNKGIDFSINNNTNSPYYSVVRDSLIQVSGASPIAIDISNQANSNVIDNVRVDAPGTNTGTPIGIKIGGSVRASHSVFLNHIDCESVSTMTGIWITDSAYNVTMNSCYFEAINKCIQIDAGCQNIKGTGIYMYNWTTNNVLDNSGAGISIEGMATVAAGAGTAFPFNYRAPSASVVFTANGSLTKAQTYGASAIRIRGVNGGGGSGGAAATTAATNSSGSGSGGGGAYAEKTLSISTLTFPLQMNVGAAGAAGASTPTAGGKGGQSSVVNNNGAGATLWTPGVQTANQGGGAGAAAATLGVAAGVGGFDSSVTSSVADVVMLGSGGANSWRVGTTAAGGAVIGAPGGSSVLGGSAAANSNTTGQGIAGLNYGGGGASVQNSGTAVALAGVAGAAGVIIVELIF